MYQEIGPRTKLRQCLNLIGKYGWTDSIYTHCSVMAEDGKSYYVNDASREFEEITEEQILRVDLVTNEVLEGNTSFINPAALIIHQILHQNRPDMQCVIHTHSVHGMAFSSRETELKPYNQLACRFYQRVSYYNYNGIVLDYEEQQRILQALRPETFVLVLRNHGLVVGGPTIEQTFNDLYLLERCVQIQNIIDSCGDGNTIDEETAIKVRNQFEAFQDKGIVEWNARVQKYLKETC